MIRAVKLNPPAPERGIHSEFVFLGYDFLPLAPRFTQHPLFPVDEITSGACSGCVVLLLGLLQVPEEGFGDLPVTDMC